MARINSFINSFKGKYNTNFWVGLYICLYFIIISFINFKSIPLPVGEWDDYSFPVVSILNEFDFSVSDSDYHKFKLMFPEWNSFSHYISFSKHIIYDGTELTWYFPTYSIFAVPFIVVLQCLDLPLSYAFVILNIVAIIVFLIVIYRCLNVTKYTKVVTVLLCSINPIIFYINWISAEVLIYSLLGIAIVFWYNRDFNKAAFLLSIAGTMNPTVMAIGVAIIVDYFVCLYKMWHKKESSIIGIQKRTFLFLCCFILSVVPFVYNYWHTGYINLTASYSYFLISDERPFERFVAYLFDINFGLFPYFPLILIWLFSIIFLSVLKIRYRFLLMISSFFLTIFAYSFMTHINCGMSGIARYNSWISVFMILIVCCYYDEVINKKIIDKIFVITVFISILLSASIVYSFGPVRANKTINHTFMTPIARFVLFNYPSFYNPLFSTFNSRVNHIDGGYVFQAPIVYFDDKHCIRKILCKAEDFSVLVDKWIVGENELSQIKKKFEKLGDGVGYVSFENSLQVQMFEYLGIGDNIFFHSEKYNAKKYIVNGISEKEDNFSWTDGNKATMRFRVDEKYINKSLMLKIVLAGTFNGKQATTIKINGEIVYDGVVTNGSNIEFAFSPKDRAVEMEFLLPGAVSPKSLGFSEDLRNLALAIKNIRIDMKDN